MTAAGDVVLVIDVGTSGLRAAVIRPDASVAAAEYRRCAPDTPFPGLVEFDPMRMSRLVLEAAESVLHRLGGPTVSAVGVATQRASTILWERSTGRPLGPGLGWQDLRTVGECLTVKEEHGLSLAPNQTATKAMWLLANATEGRDPADLCLGTIDTWMAWTLSAGALHVTDHTNAAVTGLYSTETLGWNERVCELLGIDPVMLPTIVDTSADLGGATALEGAPTIGALVGDQQASLIGQGCVEPGLAKITFGTGAMLDMVTGPAAPDSAARSEQGTFPIVAWAADGAPTWGVEAIMLSAGTNVDWLVDDLGLIDSAEASHELASTCHTSEGVVYVPALLGLGTPHWDYGARGTLLGLTRGSTRAHVVRAVLDGVAHRGADLVDATEASTGVTIGALRIDGGMSRNPTFVQALADATGRPVEISPVVEATTVGAGLLAGITAGLWDDLHEAATTWSPARVVEPDVTSGRDAARDRWAAAVSRTTSWIPELSALDF